MQAALLTATECWPAQVTIWSRYVEALMAAGETDNVKTVFGRCLMQCPSVDLWFMYLKFIKKVGKSTAAWQAHSCILYGSSYGRLVSAVVQLAVRWQPGGEQSV
jgi:hypothetical protein